MPNSFPYSHQTTQYNHSPHPRPNSFLCLLGKRPIPLLLFSLANQVTITPDLNVKFVGNPVILPLIAITGQTWIITHQFSQMQQPSIQMVLAERVLQSQQCSLLMLHQQVFPLNHLTILGICIQGPHTILPLNLGTWLTQCSTQVVIVLW